LKPAIEIIGFISLVGGVGMWSVPAALIVAGMVVLGVSFYGRIINDRLSARQVEQRQRTR